VAPAGPPFETATTPPHNEGSFEAEGYTFCSTVPAGVSIVPSGQPHAGRIIVAWIASFAFSPAPASVQAEETI